MKHSSSTLVKLATLALVTAALGAAWGCDWGGNEGDACNPLILHDECQSGLSCQQTTCARAYCCPTSGSSSDPNCNAGGCPTDNTGDGGDEGGDDGSADAADGG